jgi:hypothetical protein
MSKVLPKVGKCCLLVIGLYFIVAASLVFDFHLTSCLNLMRYQKCKQNYNKAKMSQYPMDFTACLMSNNHSLAHFKRYTAMWEYDQEPWVPVIRHWGFVVVVVPGQKLARIVHICSLHSTSALSLCHLPFQNCYGFIMCESGCHLSSLCTCTSKSDSNLILSEQTMSKTGEWPKQCKAANSSQIYQQACSGRRGTLSVFWWRHSFLL